MAFWLDSKTRANSNTRFCITTFFKSYLSNRVQITGINSKKSTENQILAGVPQGSRLGPLFWIMYYNDILGGLDCEVLIFADDICIFARGNTPEETARILNNDLAKISDWASKWKVNFNPSKTKNMLFSNKVFLNTPNILFNNIIGLSKSMRFALEKIIN